MSRVESIRKKFVEHYKDAVTELAYGSDYELLVAIMLSAQCTDKRVNIITPDLFKHYPNVMELAKADTDKVKELIKTCSFFNNKAVNLIKMAKKVRDEYAGEIPHDEKELVKLAGVGQKTANVFMIEYAGKNLMAVDTHVFRVSHRLGLSSAKTVEQTEKDLVEVFENDLMVLHQGMVLFGRYICKAKNPLCEQCMLVEHCLSKARFAVS
jgi:endonuclease-3